MAERQYMVVTQHAWLNESGTGINYSSDLRRFGDRAEAIKTGLRELGSDDFNIATLAGDRLVAFGWMDTDFTGDDCDDLNEIAKEIGLPRPTAAVCPGCGKQADWGPDDCEHCEYHNLATGRYHYCGKDSCYCRNLRRAMRREVLDAFAARLAEVLGEVGVNGWNVLDPAERARRMQGVWPVEEEQ